MVYTEDTTFEIWWVSRGSNTISVHDTINWNHELESDDTKNSFLTTKTISIVSCSVKTDDNMCFPKYKDISGQKLIASVRSLQYKLAVNECHKFGTCCSCFYSCGLWS